MDLKDSIESKPYGVLDEHEEPAKNPKKIPKKLTKSSQAKSSLGRNTRKQPERFEKGTKTILPN